jgi:hypothetical protein
MRNKFSGCVYRVYVAWLALFFIQFSSCMEDLGERKARPVRHYAVLPRAESQYSFYAESQYSFDLVALSCYSPQCACAIQNNPKSADDIFSDRGRFLGDKSLISPTTVCTIPSSRITVNPRLLQQAIPYF